MPSEITYKDIILYKTEACRNWDEKGSCRYGKRCRYAHGQEELRPILRSNQYKTKTCRAYHEHGTCSYGIRCTFIHHPTNTDAEKNKNVRPYSPSPSSSTTTNASSSHFADQNDKQLVVTPDYSIPNFISRNVWESMLGLSSYEPQQVPNPSTKKTV